MICFVTPCAPGQIPARAKRGIEALCLRLGRVHFATLALLPPAPEASALEEPSLLFEVVTDEDLMPADLVSLMLQLAFGTLWQLYRPNWSGPLNADPATRLEWLRTFLIAHASPADCGFVGARDRTVSQVCAENGLFLRARDLLQGLPMARRPPDAGALAQRMRHWAGRHGFGWIAGPVRRSPWRKGPDFGLRGWAALSTRLVFPTLAIVGLLAALGMVVAALGYGLSAAKVPFPDDPSSAVLLVALALLLALAGPILLAVSTGIGILGLAIVVLAFSAFALALLAGGLLYAICHRDFWVLIYLLDLSALGGLSLLAFAFASVLVALFRVLLSLRAPPFFPIAAIVSGMALAACLTWVCAQLMLALFGPLACARCALQLFPHPDILTRLAWALSAAAAVVLVTAIAIRLFTLWAPRMAAFANRWNRPGALPDVPAHQVHPSVQICEAALAQGQRTSHMISLTELRRPYAYHRFWLRFWLWFIQLFADYVFTEGVLGNARGIKFGHWHIIGNGRRLLFCSNFDGAFGGYLDEFIHGAAEGVNLIWQRTELRPRREARHDQPPVASPRRFPPTRLGIFRGCKAEQAFKAYARDSMVPHLFRFEAYSLSNEDIERGTRLREALRSTRTAIKDDQIARALES